MIKKKVGVVMMNLKTKSGSSDEYKKGGSSDDEFKKKRWE